MDYITRQLRKAKPGQACSYSIPQMRIDQITSIDTIDHLAYRSCLFSVPLHTASIVHASAAHPTWPRRGWITHVTGDDVYKVIESTKIAPSSSKEPPPQRGISVLYSAVHTCCKKDSETDVHKD